MAEIKKVPAIRFKGFSDEWVNSALGEVAEIKSGSTPLRSNPMFYENGNIPWVKTTDLNNSFITYTEEKITTHAKARVNPPNSVLVAMYGGFNQIGRTGLLAVPAATNQALSVLNTKENEVLALYLLTWLNAKVGFWKMLAGSSRKDPNITGSDVSAFPISFPKAIEQTQIGSYFQHLDKLISLHQTKVNKLTNLKKAMLEKMFPKQGADVPEIRFKGFAGAWKLKKFNEFAEVKRGLTYSPCDVQNEGVRVLRSSNIDEDKFVLKDDDVFVKESAINIDLVVDNDILITSANGSSRLVGKHAIVKNITHKVVHGGFMLLCRTSNAHFLNASMSTSWYKRFLDVYVAGGNGAIGNLKKTSLEEQDIYLPSDDEQIKIGTYFKNLDKTITLHQTELEKLNNLKKACLEKMFV